MVEQFAVFGLAAGVLLVWAVVIWLVAAGLATLPALATRPHWQRHSMVAVTALLLLAAVLAFVRLPAFTWAGTTVVAGAVLGLAALLACLVVSADLCAGLLLRFGRTGLRRGIRITAGRHNGVVVRVGVLHSLLRADQTLVRVPHLYLLTTPMVLAEAKPACLTVHIPLSRSITPALAESALEELALTAGLTAVDVRIAALDAATADWVVSGEPVPPADSDCVRHVLLRTVLESKLAETPGAAGLQPVVAAAPPAAAPPAAVPAVSPAPAAESSAVVSAEASRATKAAGDDSELRELKREYTAMSQQLIELEKELGMAEQGDARQALSLEKKKLEARLSRAARRIDKLQAAPARAAGTSG